MDEITFGLWWLNNKTKIVKVITYGLFGVVGLIWVYALWQFGLFLFRPAGQDTINSFGVPPPVTLRPLVPQIEVTYAQPPSGGDALVEIKNPNKGYRLAELTLERDGQHHTWTLGSNASRQVAWPESSGVSGAIFASDLRWVKVDVNRLRANIQLSADNFKLELAGSQVVASGLIRNESDFGVKTVYVTVSVWQSGELLAARTFSVENIEPRNSRLVSTLLPLTTLVGTVSVTVYFEQD